MHVIRGRRYVAPALALAALTATAGCAGKAAPTAAPAPHAAHAAADATECPALEGTATTPASTARTVSLGHADVTVPVDRVVARRWSEDGGEGALEAVCIVVLVPEDTRQFGPTAPYGDRIVVARQHLTDEAARGLAEGSATRPGATEVDVNGHAGSIAQLDDGTLVVSWASDAKFLQVSGAGVNDDELLSVARAIVVT